MLIQRANNNWSCAPAAFATATGIKLNDLIDKIGHDGSEIIYPNLSEPLNRRAFLITEVRLALLHFGWLSCNYRFKDVMVEVDQELAFDVSYSEELTEPVYELLKCSIGIIDVKVKATRRYHAVAWDGDKVYDPLGFIYPNLDRYELMGYTIIVHEDHVKL